MLSILALALAGPPNSGILKAPAPNRVERLAWMQGCWSTTVKGTLQQECWSPPHGILMLGTHLDSGEASFFEFMRVEASDDGLTLHAQPMGGSPVAFRATTIGPDNVRFENPQHDFPKFVTYRVDGDALTATVGAGEKRQTWTWTRMEVPARAPAARSRAGMTPE